MATRSRIGIELKDGSVLSAYHHWDGYPSWLGRILNTHYNSHTKASELIDGGDMSAAWGDENRGAMLRVIGGPHDSATRIENRVGDPAANPYLYLGSQIIAGLSGIDQALHPSVATETPYDSPAPALPASLIEAIAAFRGDSVFREALGTRVSDYLLTIKEAEVARFLSEVTDWEQREYFSLY